MTPELLRAATGCSTDNATWYAPHLAEGFAQYQINTPRRQAAFLAQIAHESAGFSTVVESLNYTPQGLRVTFGSRISQDEAAALGRIDGRKADQRAIANIVYGGVWGLKHLGNTEADDGWKFRGQGLIQQTGRFNARRLTQRLRERLGADTPDFEAQPELLQEPRWAALSACDYWDRTGCNALADGNDFDALTRKINGGMNGADDRRARWERAKAALVDAVNTTPEPVETLAGNEHVATEWELNNPPPPEKTMPLPMFVAAALPAIVEAIPKLARLFGSGSDVSERNLKAAEMVAATVTQAVGASNEQEAVAKLKADPAAVQAATKAVDAIWYELTEAGGGGIEGARKADAAYSLTDGPWWRFLASPSFWALILMLPLVYMIVASLIGLVGTATWSDDVRAGLAGMITGTIIGGACGYYWGQTTSRNRSAP